MKTKKKRHHQKWNTFFPELKWRLALRCTPESNYIGGDADEDHTQIFWGDTVKLLEEIYPAILPGFWDPCMYVYQKKLQLAQSHCLLTNGQLYTILLGKIVFVLNIANSIYKHFWVFHSKYHSCD